MAILITGGAGYIGSHTCVELLQAGYEVVAVDNFANSHPEVLSRIGEITGKTFAFHELDLLDTAGLSRVFDEHRIEAVIHFAGLKAVGESVRYPLLYYGTNIDSTLSLCRVMDARGVKRIVFSSSATVYGLPERVPITEDAPVGAVNPYGRTKEMIERILTDVHASDPEWGIALLRYFNPIGAHASGRIGEDPRGIPNNLLPYITQVAVGKLERLSVYGSDYPTHDGTGIRDYIHVTDLAKGHLRALERVLDRPGVDAYNLGTGRGVSVLDIVRAFEAATGRSVPYRLADRRAGDVAVCYADTAKAERELGWKAELGIEDMCRDAWRWQMQNPDGYAAAAAETKKG